MLCVKSTAERESLCRYNVCMCGNYELELKHFILPPSLSSFILFSLASSISFPPSFHLSFPSIFSAMYVFPLSLFLSFLCQAVKPHFVATAMSGIQRASRFALDPVTYTRAAVATIGIQHTTYGYFYHAIQVGISVAMVINFSIF